MNDDPLDFLNQPQTSNRMVRTGRRRGAAMPPQNAGLAAVLSFLFVGLGQIYNGNIGKAFAFMAVALLLVVVFVPLALIPWIVSICDAYSQATTMNASRRR